MRSRFLTGLRPSEQIALIVSDCDRPILKPVMLTAVDLDQLPKPSPTRGAWLVNPWGTQLTRYSQSGDNLELSDGLFGDHNRVSVLQLLSR